MSLLAIIVHNAISILQVGKLRPGENKMFTDGDMAGSSGTEIATLIHSFNSDICALVTFSH